MKLLLDENLSVRLVGLIEQDFPGSAHVESVFGRGRTDSEIWEYARSHGFAIATKDGDFRQRAFVAGPPPKVVWLVVGNAGTDAIAGLLRARRPQIENFDSAREEAVLIVEP